MGREIYKLLLYARENKKAKMEQETNSNRNRKLGGNIVKDNLDELEDGFKIPKLASGGIIENPFFIEKEVEGIFLIPKTITKKRFIKLLMSKGFQRNQAKKMHQEYIRKYKYRTQLELEIFTSLYDLKVGEIKVFVGGKEVNIKYEKDNTEKDSFNFKVVREVKNE